MEGANLLDGVTLLRKRDYSGRATMLELGGMELHKVTHVRRCLASELPHGVRHAVVATKLVQLGHRREMAYEVLGKSHPSKAFARWAWPDWYAGYIVREQKGKPMPE